MIRESGVSNTRSALVFKIIEKFGVIRNLKCTQDLVSISPTF